MASANESNLQSILCGIQDAIECDVLFVMSASGMLVEDSGEIPGVDLSVLGVLVCGIYSASEKIHEILGDCEAPTLKHETKDHTLFVFGLPANKGTLTLVTRLNQLSPDQLDIISQVGLAISSNFPADDADWMQKFDSPTTNPRSTAGNSRLACGLEPEIDLDEDAQLESDLFHSGQYDDPFQDQK